MTCSAIGTACTPRVLVTTTPRANNSGRQKVSTATADVCTHLSRGRLRKLSRVQDPGIGDVAIGQARGAFFRRRGVDELQVGKTGAKSGNALGGNLPLR